MATKESSASAHPSTTRSTRHHRYDHAFLELLQEDFGIDHYSLNKAFMGVPPAPKKQAISLCEWAIRVAAGDVDEAGDALRAWAKKHEAGLYSPKIVEAPPLTHEQIEHERPAFGRVHDRVYPT